MKYHGLAGMQVFERVCAGLVLMQDDLHMAISRSSLRKIELGCE